MFKCYHNSICERDFFLMFKFLPKTEITKQSAVCLFPGKKNLYFIKLFHNHVLLPLQCQVS